MDAMQADIRSPADVDADHLPPLSEYGKRLLAEGDSWFTFSTLWLPRNSNLLFGLDVPESAAIVNCAAPGDTLRHMLRFPRNPGFAGLLHGAEARIWDAILISAGGNDLIDAAGVPPLDPGGRPYPPEQRLLLRPSEAASGPPGERFISAPGWDALAHYLWLSLRALVDARDRGVNRATPIILHTYHLPVPRPSGVAGARAGWLWPACERYDIPGDERPVLAQALFARLRALWLAADADSGSAGALPGVHVFDSAAVTDIEPAVPGSKGVSGDWQNEIHLTPAGYRQLGRPMAAWLWTLLRERYGHPS